MSVEIENIPLKYLFLEIHQTGDLQSLHAFLDKQNISDVAELINEFPENESEILGNLSIHRAISTFKILDFPTQKRITQELSPSKTAELLNGLPADDRTSFLEDLPSEVVKELIRMLDPEERKITLSLLGYPDSSVGRLMTPDYIAVQKNWTIRQVIRHIRDVGKDSETIDVIYVVDEKGVFIDDIKIRLIILFLSEMLTATAMAYYNDELGKWLILTNFIPLIMSSGGNSGSQASTLIIQAMALGLSLIHI